MSIASIPVRQNLTGISVYARTLSLDCINGGRTIGMRTIGMRTIGMRTIGMRTIGMEDIWHAENWHGGQLLALTF